MAPIFLPELRLNAEICGPASGAPLVLLSPLGATLRLWDQLVQALPEYRILRLDWRGHGGSDTPKAPYKMGALIRDVEQLIEHFGLSKACVLGCGMGGVVAQGLAVKRADLVAMLVLSNTAPKLGYEPHWTRDIALVTDKGMTAVTAATLQGWLGRQAHSHPQLHDLQQMFESTNSEGWMGCAHALSGTDFYTPTAALTCPALVIAGYNDGIVPPDLGRELADLLPHSHFKLLLLAGHLPMIDATAEYATLIRDFLAHHQSL